MTQLFRNVAKNYRFVLPVVQEIQSSFGHLSQKGRSSVVSELGGCRVHRTQGRGQQCLLFRVQQGRGGATAGHGFHRRGWRKLLRQGMDPPVRPLDSDCCGSGCNPCIFDIYEQQLKRYYSQSCNDKPSKSCTNNCLSQTSYSAFKITKIQKDADDTFLYTFKFWKKCSDPCDQDCRLIIKPGQYCFLQGDLIVNGKLVSKPYAVFLNDKDKLSFDVVIKIWPKGQITTYVSNFKIGDEVYWRGPYGDFELSHKWDHILLIGQGTGISPLYGVICDILQNPRCETRLRLYHCCKDHKNINLRYQLHDLATFWNFNYQVFLGEEKCSDFNKLYHEDVHSRMLEEVDIRKYFDGRKDCKSNVYRVLMCGSDEFVNAVKKFLTNCGVQKELIHR